MQILAIIEQQDSVKVSILNSTHHYTHLLNLYMFGNFKISNVLLTNTKEFNNIISVVITNAITNKIFSKYV